VNNNPLFQDKSLSTGLQVAPRAAPRIIPTAGRVVIEPIEDEAVGGIILVGREQARAQMGRIKEVTPESGSSETDDEGWQFAGEEEPEFTVGEIVLFGPNSGHSIDLGYGAARVRCLILRTIEILAKVEQPDE
jgi:co-chaperonin GroES (HSP10)